MREEPDSNNWSEYPNIWGEVQRLVYNCEWYEFFDVVEAFVKTCSQRFSGSGYSDAINNVFEEEWVGWQLFDDSLEMRGRGTVGGCPEQCV